MALITFLLGLGAGAFWQARHLEGAAAPESKRPVGQQPLALSDSTLAVLKQLQSPVEIRYYDMLDPTSVNASLPPFADWVSRLLSKYQQAAPERIKITRYSALTETNQNAASADGLQPFNLAKGEACYLGIAVLRNGQRASVPPLSPEWQDAVQPDLSRAIERVAHAKPPVLAGANGAPVSAAAAAQVKRLIPHVTTVSVAQATQVLRQKALESYKEAVTQMQAQLKQAKEQYRQAQQSGSAAAQQAALKHLQQVQAEGTRKIQDIADQLQSQINALKQLKGENP